MARSDVAEFPLDVLDRFPHFGGGGTLQGGNVLPCFLAALCHKDFGTGADFLLAAAGGFPLGGDAFLAAADFGRLTRLSTGARLLGGSFADGVGFALGIQYFSDGFLRQDYTFFLSCATKGTRGRRLGFAQNISSYIVPQIPHDCKGF